MPFLPLFLVHPPVLVKLALLLIPAFVRAQPCHIGTQHELHMAQQQQHNDPLEATMADEQSPPNAATHNSPRTWLLTAACSPLAVRLTRQLLAHGDYIVACLPPHEVDHEERGREFRELVAECKSDRRDREGWRARIRGIRCDGRSMAGCGAAVAEAVEIFGRIDILLCCKSEGRFISCC